MTHPKSCKRASRATNWALQTVVLLCSLPCMRAVGFADARLQRNGRCHESEVFAAFRRDLVRYRAPEAVTDDQLRSFVRNWAAGATRSSTGYLKGVSVAARACPRTELSTPLRTCSRAHVRAVVLRSAWVGVCTTP